MSESLRWMARNVRTLLLSTMFVLSIGSLCMANTSIYHYATGCPEEEQDCELAWYECTDWDANMSCTYPTGLACEAACFLIGNFYAGWACRLGCPWIAYEICKFCEDFDVHYYCSCPERDPMESPVPLPEDKPSKGKGAD